jgi:hypothetical protein
VVSRTLPDSRSVAAENGMEVSGFSLKKLPDDAAEVGECGCQNLGNRRCGNSEMMGVKR